MSKQPSKITIDSFNNIDSIDLYVNYLCGLRCNHCFIGELLNSNVEMPLELAKSIVDKSKSNGVKSITLLGGEPTLYSQIINLINHIVENEIVIRIVTNGQKSYQKLISNLSKNILSKLHVCFSIDGSTGTVHDFIRGKGTFLNLVNSIELTSSKNILYSGITSISKDNYYDAASIISLCSKYKMEYLNVHYVTDRGFAKKEKVLSVEEWLKLCEIIEKEITDVPVRIEKTFVPISDQITCEVINKRNLIVDPLGKIYGCTMFMNIKNSESATWSTNGFEINNNTMNENCICSDTQKGCPAMHLINKEIINEAGSKGLKIDCIFNKTTVEKN